MHYATAGMSRVRFDEVIEFFFWHNLSSRTIALESTQPLTDMITRNSPGGKRRPERKTGFTVICEPIFSKMWEPRRLTNLWTFTVWYEDSFTFSRNYRFQALALVNYRCSGFNSRRYQILREVVGLERGPLSLVWITEELLEWKSSGSGSRISRLMVVGIRCAEQATPSIRKFGTNFSDMRRSVGIVRLRTRAAEFRLVGLVWLFK
jgi:hypothetical protein